MVAVAKAYRATAHCGADLMGATFWATIDFTFHPGCGATWCKRIGTWDPPEPDEWEIHSIILQHDEPGKLLGPAWKIDGALFDVIAELTAVEDAIRENGGPDYE